MITKEETKAVRPMNLTEEQKRVILNNFVEGETLLDRIVEFWEGSEWDTRLYSIKIKTRASKGVCPNLKNLIRIEAYSAYVHTTFKRVN